MYALGVLIAVNALLFPALSARAQEPSLVWTTDAKTESIVQFAFSDDGRTLLLLAEDILRYDAADGSVLDVPRTAPADVMHLSLDGNWTARLVENGEFGADQRHRFILSDSGSSTPEIDAPDLLLGALPETASSRSGHAHLVVADASVSDEQTSTAYLFVSGKSGAVTAQVPKGAKPLVITQAGTALVLAPDALIALGINGTIDWRVPTPGADEGFGSVFAEAWSLSQDEARLAVAITDPASYERIVRVYDLNEMAIAADFARPDLSTTLLTTIAFTDAGLRVAGYDYAEDTVRPVSVFDLAEDSAPQLVWTDKGNARYTRPVLSPDGAQMAIATSRDDVSLYRFGRGNDDVASSEEVQPPQLVAGLGGLNILSDIAISPDNRFVATADSQGQLWLWDISSGRAIRQFGSYDAALLAFSADASRLSISASSEILEFDIRTGDVLNRFSASAYPQLMFAPLGEGRGYLSCRIRGCYYQPPSPEELFVDLGIADRLSAAAFCGDALLLAGPQDDASIALEMASWDTGDPTSARTLARHELTGAKVTVLACTASEGVFVGTDDGRVIRFGRDLLPRQEVSLGGAPIEALSILPGEAVIAVQRGADGGWPQNPARIVALTNKTLVPLFETAVPLSRGGSGQHLDHLSISQDLTRAVTVTQNVSVAEHKASAKNNMAVWDFAALRARMGAAKDFARTEAEELLIGNGIAAGGRKPAGVTFSPGGDMLAVNFGAQSALWSLDTGQVVQQPKHGISDGVKFGTDGFVVVDDTGRLMINRNDGSTRILQMPDSSETESGFLMAGSTMVVAGDTIALAASDATIIWRDALQSDGATLPYLLQAPDTYWQQWRTFSPDGRWLLIQTYDTLQMQAVEVPDQPPIWTVREPQDGSWRFDSIGKAAFSADGAHVIVPLDGYSSDDALLALNPADGQIEARIRRGGFGANVLTVRVTAFGNGPELRGILSETGDGYATLQRGTDDTDPRRIDLQGLQPVAATMSADGRWLVVMGVDERTLLWDRITGRARNLDARLVAGIAPNHVVAFSPDGVLVAVLESTGAVSVFSTADGRRIAQLLGFEDGGWAVTGPEGRYDASDPGRVGRLSWILEDDPMYPVPVEAFIQEYYEPRLLARRIAGEAFPPLSSPQERIRVTPSIETIDILAPQTAPDGTGEVSVALHIRQQERLGIQSGLGTIKLFRDGQLVGLTENAELGADGMALATFDRIALPPNAENVTFSAYAFNQDGIKGETVDRLYTPLFKPQETAPRRAFVIAVGVNAYDNPSWNLGYAASDAEATAEVLGARLEQSGRFGEVVTVALTSHLEGAGKRLASRDVLEAVLREVGGEDAIASLPPEMRSALPEIPRARPQDFVYIALAGHGLATPDGRFLFFTQEFGAGLTTRVLPEQFDHGALDSDTLSDLLRKIDAAEMVLVIDACNSAASVEGAGFKPGPMGSRGLGQLAYDKSMRVLAASQAEAVALESDRLRHGALTYALLREGLEANVADRAPQDGEITLGEMLSFARDRVPDLYASLQDGRFEPLARGAFSLTEDESEARIDVQQPALFDFRRSGGEDVSLRAGN
ncbi:MAG: hypothetical protein ABJX32_04455 [Tateyamaria sp.]|uniref:hypothetical protein n=1 Tax=Tateyamaria sp. TaxID=1929288 RepID=UPI00329EB553